MTDQTSPDTIPAPAVVATDRAEGAATDPSSESGECCNYGLEHRWQCHWLPALRESHWGYPEEFIKRPFGAPVRAALGAQVANGRAAQMVLYRYDFQDRELNAAGRRRALWIVDSMRFVAAPVVIEPSGDEALDRARRKSVIGFLQHTAEFPVVPNAVVIAEPAARGFNGEDAVRIQTNLLKQTQNGGANFSQSGNSNAISGQSISQGSQGSSGGQ
jgi:hypothetical protein